MAVGNYLAFDLGVETGRALLGTLEDGKLTLQEKHRFATASGNLHGRLQWDLLGQWEQIKDGLRAVRGQSLDGIGVTAWPLDFGLLGPGDEILGNPVMYSDPRTHGVMAETFAKVPRADIFDATGVQMMGINTLYQLLALQRHRATMLDVAETLLFMPDLFNFLLSGVAKTDASVASASQLFDPSIKTWAADLLKRLNLPARLLPAIVPSGTVLGPLGNDVVEECGIAAAPVIAVAGQDTASAIAAVPAEGGDWAYIVSGSWSMVGVELPVPLINERTLAGNFSNEAGVGGVTRLLKHVTGLWLVQECRRQFAQDGYDHSYSELVGMAGRAKPFGVVVDPDDPPFAAPGLMPQKIAAFCKLTGQPAPTTRGATVRACFDSQALKYRQTVEALEQVTGRTIGLIHIVGAGAQGEMLNQLTADVCNRPVVAGPVEATAVGNVLVQAIATGAIADLAAARAVVRNSFAVKRYEPKGNAASEAAFERFKSYQRV